MIEVAITIGLIATVAVWICSAIIAAQWFKMRRKLWDAEWAAECRLSEISSWRTMAREYAKALDAIRDDTPARGANGRFVKRGT